MTAPVSTADTPTASSGAFIAGTVMLSAKLKSKVASDEKVGTGDAKLELNQ